MSSQVSTRALRSEKAEEKESRHKKKLESKRTSQTPPPKRRVVEVRSPCADVLRELEDELPWYDRRGVTSENRFSIALCYGSYLEGLIVASAPDDAPVPEEEVPLISRFGFYKVLPAPESVPDRLADSLFPELQRFSGDQSGVPGGQEAAAVQPFRCGGEAWCCCPEPEHHGQASGDSDEEEAASQENSQEPGSFLQVDEENSSSDDNLPTMVDSLQLVLRRMESAVVLAVRVNAQIDRAAGVCSLDCA